MVHARDAGETAIAILVAQNAHDIGPVAEVLADGVALQIGLLRQQDAVVVDDVQRAVFADVEAVEQLIEVIELHRRHGHTGELTGVRGDPSAEADAPLIGFVAVATGLERAADKHAGIAVERVGEEIIAVGEVARFGLDSRRVGDHIAVFVEQQNVALEARGGRAVEQRQMADLRGDILQVIALGGGDQALQGQVVQLDGAQDIGVDQLGDGGGTAGGRLLSVGVLADQQERDDAQNRDHGQRTAADQQQLGASGLARNGWGTARDHDGAVGWGESYKRSCTTPVDGIRNCGSELARECAVSVNINVD